MKAYSISELAELWSVSYHTIWRAIERGDLRASRLGERGSLRILESDAKAWWESREVARNPMPRKALPFSADRDGMLVPSK